MTFNDSCCSGGKCCGTVETVTNPPAMAPVMAATQAFRITGMCCVEEVRVLRAALGPLVGNQDNLSFDLLNGKMRVPASIAPNDVIAIVLSTGMGAEIWANSPPSPILSHHRLLQIILVGLSGGAVLMCMALDLAGMAPASRLAAALAIAVGLWMVLPKAFYAARSLRPDMNLLMSVAVFGAMALGDWQEAATVSFLFALSLALESWSTERARRAIAARARSSCRSTPRA